MLILSLYLFCFASLTLLGMLYRVAFLYYFHNTFNMLSSGEKFHALLFGLPFDAAIAGLLSAILALGIYISFRFLKKYTPLVPGLLCLAILTIGCIMTADIMYFADAARHMSYEITDAGQDFISLINTAFREYTLLSIGSLLFLSVYSLINVKIVKYITTRFSIKRSISSNELAFILTLAISFLGFRGGPFRSINISPNSVFAIGNSQEATIATNSAFQSIFFLIKKHESKYNITRVKLPKISRKQETKLLGSLYPHHSNQSKLSHLHKMNVVVIMLESWPAAIMKSYGYSLNTTPNFDKLRQHTFTSLGMIANGHRTSEGLFASFCSLQNPLGDSVAQNKLSFMKYDCLPKILSKRGWRTAFYEGTDKDTSGVSDLANAVGFKYTYGKHDIKHGKLPQNLWGYQDPDQYAFILKNLQHNQQPFLIGINTTTTHSLELPPSVKPKFGMHTREQKILSTLAYADTSLHVFLNNYQSHHWKYPTLFIIEADHVARITGVSDAKQYFIPFLMFSTDGSIKATRLDRMVSQRDIAPTIINKLGGYVPWFSGKSMLTNKSTPYFSDYYTNNQLGWYQGHNLTVINLENHKITCYKVPKDMNQRHPVPCSQAAYKRAQQALAFTRYNQSLIFNGKTTHFGDFN